MPGSKSLTNRALVAAALGEGTSRVTGALAGDDAEAMVGGLTALGVEITPRGPGAFDVTGSAGRVGLRPAVVDARLAGTALRFLTAVAALGGGGITVTGEEALRRRPVGALLEALRACGAEVSGSGPAGDLAPVAVGRRRRPLGGPVAVDASASSQFVTALLLVAPLFEEPLALEARGLSASGFVELTTELMERFGVEVDHEPGGSRWRVPARTPYRARDYAVPPDASAASHLFTLGLATGGTVTVEGLSSARLQPDFSVLGIFERLGAEVDEHGDGAVTVAAPSHLVPVEVDLGAMPDQLPNVAVLAALAEGTSRIGGVGITRFHETDRMAAVAVELGKAGVACELSADEVVVHGGSPRGGATFASHGDHRMAMALAALAAAAGGCRIEEAAAVTKTYRDFWAAAAALGLVWG